MGKMTGAQALVASLEAEGVECLFGYPGGQAIEIFDALYDSKMKFVLARHEQGAVHEADGYARATGRTGVVVVTSGPGAVNTVTGIATAYMDSVPLVVITGQVPTHVIGTDSFQESDIFGITLPVVKHSYLLRDVADLPYTIKKAFHIASTGRPGPVLVDVPSDVAEALVDFAYPQDVNIESYKPTVRGNKKQIRQAASALEASKRPLVLLGGGVITAQAAQPVSDLVHALQAPVLATLMGKGAFPAEDPLYLGAVGMHGSKYSSMALDACDLILAIGTHFSDRVTGAFDSFAPQAKLVHIDIDPAEIGKVIPADVPIVGDAARVAADIAAELEARGFEPQTGDWLAQVDAWRQRWPYYDEALPDNPDEIVPERLLAALSARLDADSIVTTDVGQHQMWANQMVERSLPRTFLSSGGLGTMGYGLPAAIGAALAYPDRQVVCISGDGSVQMNIQEMATAKATGAAVKVLLMDNGVLGMVRQWQGLFLDGRFAATTLDANPDFCKLAEAYGWNAERIESWDQVEPALDRMLATPGPYVLDCAMSADQNVYPMIPPGATLQEAIGAIDCDNGVVREGLAPRGGASKKGGRR